MTPYRILQIEFDDPKKSKTISSVEVVSLHSPNKKNCRNVVDARVDSLRLRPGSEKLEALQVKRKTGRYQQHLAEISDAGWGEVVRHVIQQISLMLGTLLKQNYNYYNAHFGSTATGARNFALLATYMGWNCHKHVTFKRSFRNKTSFG
jgi:hypothetical protein